MQNDATQELIQSQGYSITFLKRFWSHVQKPESPEACWIWTANKFPDGYGAISTGPVRQWDKVGAHRVSWMLHNGRPIPEGMFVCHKCDNPPCVNPAHLFLGTGKDNMEDKCQKGRHRGYRKLTELQAREILGMRGKHKRSVVADMFQIHVCTVSRIWCCRYWKHIPRY